MAVTAYQERRIRELRYRGVGYRTIATELGIPVLVAHDPADCTVQGLGHIVQNVPLYTQIGRMPPMA